MIASIKADLKTRFPNATRWALFSAVAGQREVGIGNESERLKTLEAAYQKFLNGSDFRESKDSVICNDDEMLEISLGRFYDEHDWGGGYLCSTGDSGGDNSTGYEYFWIE